MKKYAYLITLFQTFYLTAQQEPVFTQYWNNYLNSNPAMTGATYKHAASVLWKDSWEGKMFTDYPYQTTITANYAMRLDHIKSGVGLSYRYDARFVNKNQRYMATFAHHLPIKNMTLSAGVSAGLAVYNVDAILVIGPNELGKPVVSNNPQFTADAGLALRHEKWNVGISVTQLYPTRFKEENFGLMYEFQPHLWIFGDYTFNAGESWKLTPRFQLATDAVKLTDNIGITATLKENLWFGVQTRNLFSGSYLWISPLIGYDFKGKYRVGYAMNIGTEPDPFNHNYISNEVSLSFLLK